MICMNADGHAVDCTSGIQIDSYGKPYVSYGQPYESPYTLRKLRDANVDGVLIVLMLVVGAVVIVKTIVKGHLKAEKWKRQYGGEQEL